MAKRKASKGRILKTGESQRKDGIYMYRYSDIRCKRKTFYSRDLKELREQESLIQRDSFDGIRLEYAAKLLRTTKLTVSEIMFKCGFSNKSYFYREFLKQYGVSPKDYRNQ